MKKNDGKMRCDVKHMNKQTKIKINNEENNFK